MSEWLLTEPLDLNNKRSLQAYLDVADDDGEGGPAEGRVRTFEDIASMRPRVVNIGATVDFGCEFDLLHIATQLRNAEYTPRRFPGVILRIQEPKATARVFHKGNMSIIGCRLEQDAQLAARIFGRMLQKLGYRVKLRNFQISNMVAVISCGFKVSLADIANHPGHRHFATYNPEVFAGLVYRVILSNGMKVTLLIFGSGKIVMSGAKSRAMLDEAAEWIKPILAMFQHEDVSVIAKRAAEEAAAKEREEREAKEAEAKKLQSEEAKARRRADPFRRKPRS